MRVLALALLIACGASSAHADVLFTSVHDTTTPASHTFILGLVQAGSQVHLFTTETAYSSPLFDGTALSFTQVPGLTFSGLGMTLNQNSLAAPSRVSANVVRFTGVGPPSTPRLYSFRFSPQAVTFVPLQGATSLPQGLAVDSDGSVYVATNQGDIRSVSLANGASLSITDPGELTNPGALAFGPDGRIYVIDFLGGQRIVSFTTDGVFQDEFPLVSIAANALAIGPDGRLYTANVNGGGDVYDTATGAHLGGYTSTAVNPDPGKPVLGLDANHYLYLFDPNTGLHVFDTRSSRANRDFNASRTTDILWRKSGTDLAIWLMNGTAIASHGPVATVALDWTPVRVGDFDGDRHADILWRHTSGRLALWLMNGTALTGTADLGPVPTSWATQ